MNKKIVILFSLLSSFFILLALLKWGDVLDSFKKSEYLNYDKEVSYIIILPMKNPNLPEEPKEIKIEDKEKIEEFLNYINALEIVEKDRTMSDKAFANSGYFYVEVFGKNDIFNEEGVLDLFQFSAEYLTVFHNGFDWEYTRYYIRDSGYNPKDKSSKTSQYLSDLISK